jgi:hypothetical protein
VKDSHPHAFDSSGVPTSGSPDRYAGNVPDGPVMPAGYSGEFDGKEFDEHDFGPGWMPVGEE